MKKACSSPTIMLHFSATHHVDGRQTAQTDLLNPVLTVSWCEIRGDKVASISERWKRLAPDIFLDTSPKSARKLTLFPSTVATPNLRGCPTARE